LTIELDAMVLAVRADIYILCCNRFFSYECYV